MNKKHDLTKISRLAAIHGRLQEVSKRRWGASTEELADLIGADKRTVFRYLAELRGAPRYLPIDHDANRGGYHYSQEVPYFPIGSGLVHEELVALEVAQQSLAVFEGVDFAKKIQTAFEKVTGAAMDNTALGLGIPISRLVSFRTPGAGVSDPTVFEVILNALLDHRVIEMDYTSRKKSVEKKRLRLQPLHIACVSDRWILLAREHRPTPEETSVRTYVIARFSKPVPTRITFKYPADFRPEHHVQSAFDVQSGPLGAKPVLVKLRISERGAHHILERKWHPTQQVTLLPAGDIEVAFTVSHTGDIKRWILGFGSDCKVVAPASLRRELAEEARLLLDLYPEVLAEECSG